MRQNPIFSTSFGSVTYAKYRILSHFSFPKHLFRSFLHYHCLQFLYPTNFLVRECFSLLVYIPNPGMMVQSIEKMCIDIGVFWDDTTDHTLCHIHVDGS